MIAGRDRYERALRRMLRDGVASGDFSAATVTTAASPAASGRGVPVFREFPADSDFVVQFEKQALQLSRLARGRVPAGSQVIVRQTREGPLRVVHVDRKGVAQADAGRGPVTALARQDHVAYHRP